MNYWALLSFVCIVSILPLKAESALSGPLTFGQQQGPSPTSNEGQVKEVVATGIGADAVSAEKQALIAAVQQAVGAFLDTKSITENEEVIKDRVLSLSNGFVSKYDVISGPKQRDDKLFEVTIKAQVQGGQVVAKLKEVNLIKGEVAGQNLYAQNLTQMMSSDDACKMLNEKLPELIVNCIKMEFVDKDGNPQPNSNPVEQVRDDQAQQVKCTWYVKTSVDKAFYAANIYPMFKRCLDAIFTGASEDMELNNIQYSVLMEHSSDEHYKRLAKDSLATKTIGKNRGWNASFVREAKNFFLIKSVTRDGTRCDGTYYSGKDYILKGKSDPEWYNKERTDKHTSRCFYDLYNQLSSSVELKVLSKSAELIAFGESRIADSFNPTRQILGPFVDFEREGDIADYASVLFKETEIACISVDLAISDLKDVGKVEVSLKPKKYDLEVLPAKHKK